jgi:predicted metal-dependent hydrolase
MTNFTYTLSLTEEEITNLATFLGTKGFQALANDTATADAYIKAKLADMYNGVAREVLEYKKQEVIKNLDITPKEITGGAA